VETSGTYLDGHINARKTRQASGHSVELMSQQSVDFEFLSTPNEPQPNVALTQSIHLIGAGQAALSRREDALEGVVELVQDGQIASSKSIEGPFGAHLPIVVAIAVDQCFAGRVAMVKECV
jgi:hypothetical protein